MRAQTVQSGLDRHRKSYRWLANQINRSHESVRLWVQGRSFPKSDYDWEKMLQAVQELDGTATNGKSGVNLPQQSALRSLTGMPMVEILVVGKDALQHKNVTVRSEQAVISVPEKLAIAGDFAYIVDTDSMMPILEPGDIAIIRKSDVARRLPFLIERNGELRFVQLRWRDSKWMQGKLNALDGETPIEGWRLIGYLVGWFRSRGTRETIDYDSDGLRLDVP